MWKKLVVAAGALPIVGCNVFARPEDPAIVACEVSIKALIKSPSSYKREQALIDKNEVIVLFEAANSFGAPIRNTVLCRYDYEASPLAGRPGSYSIGGISFNGRYLTEQERLTTVPARLDAKVLSFPEGETALKRP